MPYRFLGATLFLVQLACTLPLAAEVTPTGLLALVYLTLVGLAQAAVLFRAGGELEALTLRHPDGRGLLRHGAVLVGALASAGRIWTGALALPFAGLLVVDLTAGPSPHLPAGAAFGLAVLACPWGIQALLHRAAGGVLRAYLASERTPAPSCPARRVRGGVRWREVETAAARA